MEEIDSKKFKNKINNQQRIDNMWEFNKRDGMNPLLLLITILFIEQVHLIFQLHCKKNIKILCAL